MVQIKKGKNSFANYERLEARRKKNIQMSKILKKRHLARKPRRKRVKAHSKKIKGKKFNIKSYLRKLKK